MAFRPSRSAGPGRFLVARGALFVLGGGCAVVGMVLPSRILVWVAIAILLVAFLLRFTAGSVTSGPEGAPGDAGEDEETAPPAG
ncbi:MAG: hypothetical protein R3E98_10565 [Gemmatimonadota bacterium]